MTMSVSLERYLSLKAVVSRWQQGKNGDGGSSSKRRTTGNGAANARCEGSVRGEGSSSNGNSSSEDSGQQQQDEMGAAGGKGGCCCNLRPKWERLKPSEDIFQTQLFTF